MKKRAIAGSLLTLLLLACASTSGTPEGETGTHVHSGGSAPTVEASAVTVRWSNASTWGGKVPAEGASVTIPAGKIVLLDVSPPRLGSVTIPAGSALVFEDGADRELRTDWIMVHGGRLEIGTEAQPFTHRATITLTDARPGENVMDMGDKFIGLMGGGTLELHGQPRLSWTRLAATARAGQAALTLTETPNWKGGDTIVLASTDFDHTQAETAVVAGVSGTTVTLTAPLKNGHYGEVHTFAGRTLSERGEVGLLSRNVTVQGESSSSAGGFGGHVMIMGGSRARVENAQFTRMGQLGINRRYPLHFHMLGDASTSYVRNNSLHGLFNRCVTIHGTNNLTVRGNVAAGTVGHCFFLEDGAEVGNVLENNLGLSTRNAAAGKAVLPSDRGVPGAATYWVTNPDNTLRGNVAAGGDGTGFWYGLPQNPTGLSATTSIWPRRTALRLFKDNVAHSYVERGLNVDDGPRPDGTIETVYHEARVNPADEKSEGVTTVFENFTAYKNRSHGVWLRGRNHVLKNATLADNGIGATFASFDTTFSGGLVVGETANVGQTHNWETVGLGGRSLPRHWDPSFPIRGYEFYDGRVGAEGVVFANFQPNTQRPASALGFVRKNHFPVSPRNWARGLTFVNATPVYLENPSAESDGDQAAVFLDTDGSVTGTAGRYVTASAPLLWDASCGHRAAWNAYVCDKPYGKAWFEDVSGSGAGKLTVTRTDGANVTFAGVPGRRTYVSSALPAQAHYALRYERGAPNRLRIGLDNRAVGNWLRLTLPFTGEPYIYRDWWIDSRSRLKKVTPAQLDATQGDSYALVNGTLYLKLQVQTGREWAVLDVCKQDLCR
ncbi:G8 domain-containing protein [Deinococcus sp. YIM 134068]|uniref:G8 domain-containing protein n=1 Tax=Deinococcus lichenicola TaxID=3118910 RepID=UPI002F950BAC